MGFVDGGSNCDGLGGVCCLLVWNVVLQYEQRVVGRYGGVL